MKLSLAEETMISTSNLSLRLSGIPPEEVDRNHHHPSSSSSPLSASVVAGEEDGVDDRDYPNMSTVHVIHEWSWAGTPNEGASWLRLQRLADTWHQILLIPVTGGIMEPPWKAYNVLRKMDYPYEHIVHSMKDPRIANFWLITLPQIVGGFDYDEDAKKKIWLQYEESMRYDQLRDLVAKRNPGWEYLQDALFSIDPVRAQEDPVIVKNVPFYKAKKALEAEVTKLNPPPRPQNWAELNLPLNTSSWSEEDLKNPAELYEKTVLLNAQREIADKILDAQWEAKWRQEKVEEMLEEKKSTSTCLFLVWFHFARKLLSSLPMKAKESYAGGSGGITGETGLVISRDASFVEKCHVLS
ncbi:hypothetical protein Bca101_067970 [Brassica carinata]